MSRQNIATEQKVLRGLKSLPKSPRQILLALSGGVDSMVMAEVLYKWRTGLRLKLAVAHVHHGPTPSPKQKAYRRRTQKFVKEWARERELPFFTNETAPTLTSEQGLREFRLGLLGEWLNEIKGEAVAFAHHRDDLLETRLIRLIRGSGNQGLRSMSVYSLGKFRPLLGLSSREIRAYAESCGLKWIEDPSNAESNILRNWMRHEWLPSLETQRPGALKSLARSLETVSPPTKEFDLAPYVGLRRELFRAGSSPQSPQSRELLAQYLKALGLKNYAQTHVDEILKRLSCRQRDLEFEMLGLRFSVSADFLWASRV
jgi:tRNA(Ile)-lysidine synthase